jgi:hypothetical protein
MKAGYFLGVFSVEQGRERIRLWQFITVMFFCVFLYELLSALLFWNVVNSDSRDIVDDFRRTLPAVQRSHDKFYNDADLYQFRMFLATPRQKVEVSTIETETFHSTDIPNPTFASLPESFKTYLSDTSSKAKYYSSKVPLQFGTFGGELNLTAELQIEFTDRRGAITALERVDVISNAYSKLYRLRIEGGAGKMQIERLAKVEVYLYYDDEASQILYIDEEPQVHHPSWRISHIRTTFEAWWEGGISSLTSTLASGNIPTSDELNVLIELRDVNQPYPDYPRFTGKSQILIALLLGLIGVICLIYYGYLSYTIRLNSALNNNRPPPFFAGMRKFRGW